MDGEFNPSEYDLGAGGPPIQQEKTIESELEQIMEKSFAEKAVKLSEIRVKYEMQIKEMRDRELYSEMVSLKTTMEEEIDKVSQNLDFQRKNDIEKARRSFLS